MGKTIVTRNFLMVASSNFFLILIVATWSLLPLYIVDLGGRETDVGIVMSALGVTSFGALPFVAPLLDRYGRKIFIIWGAGLAGASNLAYLVFDHFSLWFILIRLVQGIAFACCFNACVASIVDNAPAERRAQAIGWFGISGSLAFAIGPYLGEETIIHLGFKFYFILLFLFGAIGAFIGSLVKESERMASQTKGALGFFGTARKGKYPGMILVAVIFGSAFASMNTFFPLYASGIGLRAGFFYMGFGTSLILTRLFFGQIGDRIEKEKIIFSCFASFTVLLAAASQIFLLYHTVILGLAFGVIQAFCYPAMMARMVEGSNDSNRGVVVSLFTGAMGLGINLSPVGWGFVADLVGLTTMYIIGSAIMFFASVAVLWAWRKIIA